MGKHGREDVCILECTPRYPVQTAFVDALQDTHKCLHIMLGPEMMGWPHRRKRLLAAGVCLSTTVWCGPDDMDELAADFSDRFHRSVAVSGDIFAMACSEEVAEEYVHFAHKQGHFLDKAAIQQMGKDDLLRALLPAGGVQRYKEWLQHGEQEQLGSLGGSFLFDVDHHPNTRGVSGGSHVPTHLRHGTVMMVRNFEPSSWRLLLGLEHFASMGFHIYPQMCGVFAATPMLPTLHSLSPEQLKRLLGNGMHLATQAAWMCYVLGHCASREQHSRLPTMISSIASRASEDHDELDVDGW